MNDAVRRSLRGLLQVGVIEGFINLAEAFGVTITSDQHTAIILAFTPILTLVQNLLEDNTGMPALLKAPASSGVNPQPDGAQ